jgi:hypothetical protein
MSRFSPYSHHSPVVKQAADVSVEDALNALSPTDSLLQDYALYAGGGGLAGAGAGALLNTILGGSKLKGALIGGGIGAGLGAGTKALGDYALSDQKTKLEDLMAQQAALRKEHPLVTGDGYFSSEKSPRLSQLMNIPYALANMSSNTPMRMDQNLSNQIASLKQKSLLDALRQSISDKF